MALRGQDLDYYHLAGDISGYVATADYTAAIGATSILPTAFTATLPADLCAIALIPQGDVYIKFAGAASANTTLVPSGGIVIPCTKAVADLIQIFAGAVRCSLIVLDRRV